VFTADGVTASGVHGNKILVAKECQDLPHFNCPLIAKDGDCKGHTRKGVNYGKSICQLSCGNCDPIEDDAISTDQICYPFGRQIIQVTFLNSIPHDEDWVGIYPDTADPYDLGSPVAWFWLCSGDKRRKCKTSAGSITFPWLPPGTYKAIMSRNHDAKGPYASYGPYSSYAESSDFEVFRGGDMMCKSRRIAAEEDSMLKEPVPTSNTNSRKRDDGAKRLRGRRD